MLVMRFDSKSSSINFSMPDSAFLGICTHVEHSESIVSPSQYRGKKSEVWDFRVDECKPIKIGWMRRKSKKKKRKKEEKERKMRINERNVRSPRNPLITMTTTAAATMTAVALYAIITKRFWFCDRVRERIFEVNQVGEWSKVRYDYHAKLSKMDFNNRNSSRESRNGFELPNSLVNIWWWWNAQLPWKCTFIKRQQQHH